MKCWVVVVEVNVCHVVPCQRARLEVVDHGGAVEGVSLGPEREEIIYMVYLKNVFPAPASSVGQVSNCVGYRGYSAYPAATVHQYNTQNNRRNRLHIRIPWPQSSRDPSCPSSQLRNSGGSRSQSPVFFCRLLLISTCLVLGSSGNSQFSTLLRCSACNGWESQQGDSLVAPVLLADLAQEYPYSKYGY